jgi:heavy metal sensor kinase
VNLSLRARLTLWFTLVMAASLAVFGFLTYSSVSSELYTTLDVSLNKMVSSLDLIIRGQAEAKLNPPNVQPRKRGDTADELAFLRKDSLGKDTAIKSAIKPLPSEDKEKGAGSQESGDAVWMEIYEHIALTPRNHMIQILDSTGGLRYRSANLLPDTLVLPAALIENARDSVAQISTIMQSLRGKEPEMIRVAVARSRSALIIAAYPVDEVTSLLEDFFSTLLILGPIILLFASVGGFFLAKASLHPLDEIIRTAQDITASNLSRRLPTPSSNDEIRRLSDTLNDMISRLESSFERIRQFTADASHELRTPLTILTGELELALRKGRKPEEYQQTLSSALQEVLRLSRVVESLLLLSRADMGRASLHLEPTNLTEMLADLADAASVLGVSKSIYINYRPSEDLHVMADNAKLYQMFLNLVDNAVKYTPEGGLISMTIHRDGADAEVRVRDTGIGISPENQKKIFDRFYRVDKARSRELGGVGLGLSIVRWTVEAHSGTIRVESEPGQGSTFIVRIPLLAGPAEATPAEDAGAEARRSFRHSFELGKILKRG